MKKTLRLLLGDQLNAGHMWFQSVHEQVTFVMMEVRSETDYARHHIQKVTGIFAAMRAFADDRKSEGHQFCYFSLNDETNKQSISENIKTLITRENFERFEYQLPDEYRLDEILKKLCAKLSIETEAFDSEHFLTSRTALKQFFEGRKTYLMESFYRHIRIGQEILMEGKNPLTGRWNYDTENREPLKEDVGLPERFELDNNVSELVKMVRDAGVETMGEIDPEHFPWPVTRKQALQALEDFTVHRQAQFGTFQDAMSVRDWSLFHSRISFALNLKILHPREVIDAAIATWKNNQEKIPFAALEGFVRQIAGWREYMRGIYWAQMPEFSEKNFFNNSGKLPEWYWTGKTRMNCLHHAISESLQHGYAHHIQRLMITGNFALLAGCDPDEVDQWYLGIYIDAFEWVEITNTRGMSQYADGGLVGTKPYVSSARYIHKMSDYCDKCHYDYRRKTGEKACPFNSLYWAFYEQHRDKLQHNPRIGFVYPSLNRMKSDDKQAMLAQAEFCLKNLNKL